MSLFRILCFGQLAVLKDGSALPPGAVQPRRLALLAILAVAGERTVTRDKLASLLWPDSDEEKSRRSLAQALYALRRDMGSEEAIVGVRDLRLNEDLVQTDLADFEALRGDGALERAAALYAGPLLDGFQLSGLPDFERWHESERASWSDRHRELVERLAKDAERGGDRAAAVKWWRGALAHDPHNARLTVHLMRALARLGDRAAAIRQSEIYVTLVTNDLEIAPDPTVLREADEIRRAETPHEVTAEIQAAKPAARPPAPPLPATQDRNPLLPVPDTPDATSVSMRVASPSVQPATADAATSHARPWTSRGKVAAGVGVVAVAAVTLAVAHRSWWSKPPTTAAVAASLSRILVVPPRNNTGDSTLDLVGTMAAEWITSSLSQTGLVDVIDSRTMLDAMKGPMSEASVHDFAVGAGVGTLVTGSVSRDRDSLMFDLLVADATTGDIKQSIPRITAPVAHPTAALEPLRQKVAGALAVLFDINVHNLNAASSRPPTWQAYQEFLMGMAAFGADYESTLAHFRRAVALDSSYWQARLWAGITSANMRRYPQADSIFRSLAAALDRLGPYDRATLDYFQLGFVNGNWEGSYRGAKRMAELAPGAGHALYALGTTATFTARPEEALTALGRIDLDRGWGVAWAVRILNLVARSEHVLKRHSAELADALRMQAADQNLGWVRVPELRALAAMRRIDELERRVTAAMTLPATETTWEPFSHGDMLLTVARELTAHGDTGAARRFLGRAEAWYRTLPGSEGTTLAGKRGLARVLYTAGKWREAGELFGELHAVDSTNVEDRAGLALVAARTGDSAYARSVSAALQGDQRPYRFGAPAVWAARIAAVLDRREESVTLLRRGVAEGHTRTHVMHTDPDLMRLAGYPPFQEFLRSRG